jgi:DNA-binding NtrC family response regulator
MTRPDSKSIRKAYHEDLSILVVEDYMVFSKEVRHALPEHRIVFARTIEQAKARYEESLPHITFLDLDLPDGSGFILLDYIRARDPTAFVIILSGSKMETDIATAGVKKAQGYIIKPFTRSMVRHYIDEYMNLREKSMKALVEETNKRRATEPTAQS